MTRGETRGVTPDQRNPGPPTWPMHPKPITPVHTVSAEPVGDDGVSWDAVAFGLAGAVLALTLAGTLVGLRRRSHRPRAAA
jgi:hypothetical protein